jgi:hypothetical protein
VASWCLRNLSKDFKLEVHTYAGYESPLVPQQVPIAFCAFFPNEDLTGLGEDIESA